MKVLRVLWDWLRTATGDNAYERYLEHRMRHHPGEPLMTRGAYFAERQQRKWSGVSRCC
jgi:uncharacterized short protein YbdD (DUF466 family)